jgi:hypothetical protein
VADLGAATSCATAAARRRPDAPRAPLLDGVDLRGVRDEVVDGGPRRARARGLRRAPPPARSRRRAPPPSVPRTRTSDRRREPGEGPTRGAASRGRCRARALNSRNSAVMTAHTVWLPTSSARSHSRPTAEEPGDRDARSRPGSTPPTTLRPTTRVHPRIVAAPAPARPQGRGGMHADGPRPRCRGHEDGDETVGCAPCSRTTARPASRTDDDAPGDAPVVADDEVPPEAP